MVKTYNPKKVTCSLGTHIVSGYADDSMISIDYAGDGVSVIHGADGEVVRSIDPSKGYTLKLALLQSSPTNEYLTSMFKKDQADGSGSFNININDIIGNEKFVGQSAWVIKPATFGRGKAAANREWEIYVADGDFN